jgi:hypothetical protein
VEAFKLFFEEKAKHYRKIDEEYALKLKSMEEDKIEVISKKLSLNSVYIHYECPYFFKRSIIIYFTGKIIRG